MEWPSKIGIGIVVIAAGLLVAGLVYCLLPGSPRRRSRKWIREYQAPITAESTSEVERARSRGQVGLFLGGLVGVVLAVPFLLQRPGDDEPISTLWIMAPFLAIVAMSSIGQSVAGLIGAARHLGPLRVAHSRAARLSDYVNPSVLILLRVEMVLVLGAAVVAGALSSRGDSTIASASSGSVVPLLVGFVVSWVAVEIVAHRLAARPQPSDHAVALFWRDAVRAEQLTDIWMCLPSVCYFFALSISWTVSLDGWLASAAILFPLAVMVLNVVAQQLSVDRSRLEKRRRELVGHEQSFETV